MTSYKDKHFGFMKDYLKKEDVAFVGESGPSNNFKVASNKTTVAQAMKSLATWKGINVYAKKDIPEHMHYKENKKVLDILLVSAGKEIVMPFMDGKRQKDVSTCTYVPH